MTGTMGEARVPNPTPRLRSIHQRTITALRVQQRLLGDDPLWTNQLHISMKKLMARIRITEEGIADGAGVQSIGKAVLAALRQNA